MTAIAGSYTEKTMANIYENKKKWEGTDEKDRGRLSVDYAEEIRADEVSVLSFAKKACAPPGKEREFVKVFVDERYKKEKGTEIPATS